MSQDFAESNGSKPPAASLVRREGGRFAPGTAGGPGRPKRGVPIGESWRRDVNWERMREVLETIATSAKAKDADRISAIRELLDRAWGKPLSSHELHVSQGEPEPRSLAHLSDARLAELLAEIDGGPPQLPEQVSE